VYGTLNLTNMITSRLKFKTGIFNIKSGRKLFLKVEIISLGGVLNPHSESGTSETLRLSDVDCVVGLEPVSWNNLVPLDEFPHLLRGHLLGGVHWRSSLLD